jgi:hypothetical protein
MEKMVDDMRPKMLDWAGSLDHARKPQYQPFIAPMAQLQSKEFSTSSRLTSIFVHRRGSTVTSSPEHPDPREPASPAGS